MKKMSEISMKKLGVKLPDGSYKNYKLDRHINDPDLSDAVMYACKLIDEDHKTIDEAVNISGKQYRKNITDIRLNLPRALCENAPSKDEMNYRLYVDVSLEECFELVAVIMSDHNMCCCETRAPYLLTKINYQNGNDVYSCQCSCGGWCTNGHEHPEDAVREYESMCERYIKKHRVEA